MAAMACPADPAPDAGVGSAAHRVATLYDRIGTTAEGATHEAVFGEVPSDVDGERQGRGSWPDCAVTTRLDTADPWSALWDRGRPARPALATVDDVGGDGTGDWAGATKGARRRPDIRT